MIFRLIRYLRKIKKNQVEEKQLEAVLEYLLENQQLSIIDLGFNLGAIYNRIRQVNKNSFYYGFEIQSDLVNNARQIKDQNFSIIHGAATDRDGYIQFYEPKSWSKNYKGGATIMSGKNNLAETPISVPSIDLSNWLEDHSNGEEKYFIKIDIEGAEYNLLENLINKNSLTHFKGVAIEWHCSKLGEQNEAKYLARKNLIKLALWEAGVDYFEWF